MATHSFVLRCSSAFAEMDLADLSLLDALTQAATDVLGSIPAQRCIVYIYDKAANLLRSQIVVDCRDKEAPTQPEGKAGSETSEQPRDASKSSAVGFKKEVETTTLLVSFPPVMGMVSSCFLQRRCLRMQEANPHRAFHREYDVPKDMQVDSILCAPVILYHRAAAVIQNLRAFINVDTQLLNRLDTTERATTRKISRTSLAPKSDCKGSKVSTDSGNRVFNQG
ncbi:GAF domain-like [Phytophthora cactorum]|nr:GAF domain-like [Phytophthora cactorum]